MTLKCSCGQIFNGSYFYVQLNLANHLKDECPAVLSKTVRKLQTKIKSLKDFGLPKNLIEKFKAEIERPFNYLEFGQDDLTEPREYVTM